MSKIDELYDRRTELLKYRYKAEKELVKAFDKCEDAEEQFKLSIAIARLTGVPEESIIKSKEEIDNYFTK